MIYLLLGLIVFAVALLVSSVVWFNRQEGEIEEDPPYLDEAEARMSGGGAK